MTKQSPGNEPSESGASHTATANTGVPGAADSKGESSRHSKPGKLDAKELEALKVKAENADKYYDEIMRARAEFDNYRRRISQERQYAELAANEKLLQKLIGILDTFELAIQSAEKDDNVKALLDGLKLLQSQFQTVLKESGVEEIDTLHRKFDPNFHEAIRQFESDDFEEGTVVEQVRKGYRFKDRLLRPASVIVSTKPDAGGPAPGEGI